MRCYSHLSDDEREQIGLAKALGHSIGAIAQAISRPKSTISRELSRNVAERIKIECAGRARPDIPGRCIRHRVRRPR